MVIITFVPRSLFLKIPSKYQNTIIITAINALVASLVWHSITLLKTSAFKKCFVSLALAFKKWYISVAFWVKPFPETVVVIPEKFTVQHIKNESGKILTVVWRFFRPVAQQVLARQLRIEHEFSYIVIF